MPVDRPTFNESWYRVATLRPRLRSTVQTYRQHYRGQMWQVVRDPGNNQFFRLDEAGYTFVGLLDGRRTVEQVWDVCNRDLGDRAPTQQEAIQLLGQLYTSNLLASELPADAAGMFDRYKKRVRREIGGYLQNLLFVRIPLIDPDAFLDRWVGLFGLAFTKLGFILWAILLALGINTLAGDFENLRNQYDPSNILDPNNLIFLYLSFAIIKGFHEFGHGFACKKFGRDSHSGGEVHTMGIMFLVFMPVPYVDASSSWALRSKWQRMMIGAGGMYIELAIASIAAMVWSNTEGGAIHAIAFNIMFIASVSTLLFNGNPLLRFDAYYILSDILEIPNLSQRGKQYLYYLVRRYAYGVRKPRNPAHTAGERFWLMIYGIASFVYRIFICVGILMFVADRLFILGALLGLAATVTWVFLPLGKWVHYLITSPELLRTRQRAVLTTVGTLVFLFTVFGMLPFEEHDRAEGVVEPRNLAIVFMEEDGRVTDILPSDTTVEREGQPLLRVENPELITRKQVLEANRDEMQSRIHIAMTNQDPASVQTGKELLDAVNHDLNFVQRRVAALNMRASLQGKWVMDKPLEDADGSFLQRGTRIGVVVDLSRLIIRTIADQELGPRIKMNDNRQGQVEIRVKGWPGSLFEGKIEDVYVAGQQQLPYPSLGYAIGGSVQTALDDPSGTRTAEQFFEVRIGQLENKGEANLYPGQRMVVRFNLGYRPLATQWWRKIRQVIQRRFGTLF